MSLYTDIAAANTSISAPENSPISADFCFKKDLNLFNGHFPEKSILPGIMQIEMVKYDLEKAWNVSLRIDSIKKTKFSSLISPEDPIQISIGFDRACDLITVRATLRTHDQIAGKINMVMANR